MRPVFEIADSTVHYIHAGGSYQQTTDTECAACTAVVEMTSPFWWSRAPCGKLLGHDDYKDHRRIAAIHL